MTTVHSTATCAVKPVLNTKPRNVSVNGASISRAAIAREIQNHPATKPMDAWLAAARALVVRELLLQEARRLSIVAEPATDAEGRRETDEEALIRQVVAREVKTPHADVATARRYYDSNRRRFRSSDLYEVRHILLPAAGDAKARAFVHEQALALIAELRRKGDAGAFATAAQSVSACPSAKVGGSLGQIGPGQTVPEFETALAAMPVGEVAPEAVETRYGFHIVRVDNRIEGRELPFDAVQERIVTWLDDRARRIAVRQYLSLLAGRAKIEGIDLPSSPSPLVQ